MARDRVVERRREARCRRPGCNIWTSNDYGQSWTERTNVGGSTQNFEHMASSKDGSTLYAIAYGRSLLWASYDYGASWSDLAPAGSAQNWHSIACSSDGSKVAAVVDGGNIWTNTEYGWNAWTERTPGGSTRAWISIASSDDGSRLAAVVSNGYVYVSADYGATWAADETVNPEPWVSVASSSDGSKLAVVERFIFLYDANCYASDDPTKDGSDGYLYCVNGGDVGGFVGSCTCTNCDPGFGGASCEESCQSKCAAASQCCNNDPAQGSNQKLSCLQACMVVTAGIAELECLAYCPKTQAMYEIGDLRFATASSCDDVPSHADAFGDAYKPAGYECSSSFGASEETCETGCTIGSELKSNGLTEGVVVSSPPPSPPPASPAPPTPPGPPGPAPPPAPISPPSPPPRNPPPSPPPPSPPPPTRPPPSPPPARSLVALDYEDSAAASSRDSVSVLSAVAASVLAALFA